MGQILIEDPMGIDGGTGKASVVNLAGGNGQMGHIRAPADFAYSSRYTQQRLITSLVAPPAAMRYLPDYPQKLKILRSLFEDRAITVTGLNMTTSWENTETPDGLAGHQYKSITNATVEPSAPVFEWPELHNQTIARFWTEFGVLFNMDPYIKKPGIIYTPGYENAPDDARIPLIDANLTSTLLCYEPTVDMRGVVKAWLLFNVRNMTGGEMVGANNGADALAAENVSIEFSCNEIHSKGAYLLAYKHLASINRLGLNSNNLKGFVDDFAADVLAAGNSAAQHVNSNLPNG